MNVENNRIKLDPKKQKDFEIEDWVYFPNAKNKFYNLKNGQSYSAEGFNTLMGYKLPADNKKTLASRYFLKEKDLFQISSKEWCPREKEQVFQDIEENYVLNTFNSNSLPKPAKVYTTSGKWAVDTIEKHFDLICGNKKDADIVKQWFALARQEIGIKIPWALVFVGSQGIGKSTMLELGKVLFDKNARKANMTDLRSNFSDYATSALMAGIDELDMSVLSKDNKLDLVKSAISEKTYSFTGKYKKTETIENYTNYYFCTNYINTIPLEERERRYCIIQSKYERDQLAKAAEKTYEDYMYDLRKAIYSPEFRSQIVKFFMEYPVTEEFRKTTIAPMTEAAKHLIATTKTNIYGRSELCELLEKGGDFWNKDVVIPSVLEPVLIEKILKDESLGDKSEFSEAEMLAVKTKLKFKDLLKKEDFITGDVIKLGKKGNLKSYRYWSRNGKTSQEAKRLLVGNNKPKETPPKKSIKVFQEAFKKKTKATA